MPVSMRISDSLFIRPPQICKNLRNTKFLYNLALRVSWLDFGGHISQDISVTLCSSQCYAHDTSPLLNLLFLIATNIYMSSKKKLVRYGGLKVKITVTLDSSYFVNVASQKHLEGIQTWPSFTFIHKYLFVMKRKCEVEALVTKYSCRTLGISTHTNKDVTDEDLYLCSRLEAEWTSAWSSC